MRWALSHLHPGDLANTVNIPFSHNSHTNRLFWRVDANTMLGRFYLMHMLCVRPETSELHHRRILRLFIHSGNVPVGICRGDYRFGRVFGRRAAAASSTNGRSCAQDRWRRNALARSLNDWTTSLHRENIRHSVVFHAGELPDKLNDVNAEADAFVAEVARHLTPSRCPIAAIRIGAAP